MFLLSTQICWDISAGADIESTDCVRDSVAWFASLPDPKSVGLSCISYGQILTGIELLDCATDRRLMQRNFKSLLAQIAPPFPVDAKTAAAWSELEPLLLETVDRKFNADRRVPMTNERRLVVATAIRHNRTLVETAQPYHSVVNKKFGLNTLDPKPEGIGV